MITISNALALLALVTPSLQHLVLSYPGTRGNNLVTNGTLPNLNPDTIGIDYNTTDGSHSFPYGMQWMYPCGGMPLTTNRTTWPVNGGALAFQPGWFSGHSTALLYVNIGIQEAGDKNPLNMSHNVISNIGITGPSNNPYPGSVCFPQVGMPANLSLSIGTNITIQVVEIAQHGAALYSCVDVTLADPADVEEVTKDNCHNDTWIGFTQVFTTASLTSAATTSMPIPPTLLSILSSTILVSVFASTFWI